MTKSIPFFSSIKGSHAWWKYSNCNLYYGNMNEIQNVASNSEENERQYVQKCPNEFKN